MEIQFYGGNCVRISSKKATVVTDDTLGALGLKSVTKPEDVAVFTQQASELPEVRLAIDSPGEYEAAGVSVKGIAARALMDEEGQSCATMYKIDIEDISVAVVGHIYPDLTDDQLEDLGMVDVLVVPVGGSGYTLDPIGALKVIKSIEPKVIIPTHYEDKAVKYEVPQAALSEALKGLAMEPAETTAKLKLKAGDLPEIAQLVVLERQ